MADTPVNGCRLYLSLYLYDQTEEDLTRINFCKCIGYKKTKLIYLFITVVYNFKTEAYYIDRMKYNQIIE